MRIVLMIMADVMALVAAVIAVNEYHGLKRYASFTVPFTEKMAHLGVIDPAKKESILREEKILHVVGIALCALISLLLAKIFAGVSAVIVFTAGAAVQLFALKPEMEESARNRSRYFDAHKKDMNAVAYHEYLQKTEGDENENAAQTGQNL